MLRVCQCVRISPAAATKNNTPPITFSERASGVKATTSPSVATIAGRSPPSSNDAMPNDAVPAKTIHTHHRPTGRTTRSGNQTVARSAPPRTVAVLCSQTNAVPTCTHAWSPSSNPIAANALAIRTLNDVPVPRRSSV